MFHPNRGALPPAQPRPRPRPLPAGRPAAARRRGIRADLGKLSRLKGIRLEARGVIAERITFSQELVIQFGPRRNSLYDKGMCPHRTAQDIPVRALLPRPGLDSEQKLGYDHPIEPSTSVVDPSTLPYQKGTINE
jgi:hypothetical protein